MHRTRIAAVVALLIAAPLAHAAPSGERWDWSVAPYLWLTSIKADVQTGTPPLVGSNFNQFDDVLDDLDGAFLIHGEGQGDDFGVFADFIFLGLAKDRQFQVARTESDLDARIFEVAGVWSPNAERMRGFELFGGLRSIDTDFTMQLVPTNPNIPRGSVKISDTFNDFLLGGRYTAALSDRWSMTLRADGSWGDTDSAWNLAATAQYRFDYGALALGWRHFDVELQNGGNALDVAFDGPQVGYVFTF